MSTGVCAGLALPWGLRIQSTALCEGILMLWLAFYIVAFTSWFAMLFYLPRLFVYHQMADDAVSKERFCLMEHKLYKLIGTPGDARYPVAGIAMAAMGWDYYKTRVVSRQNAVGVFDWLPPHVRRFVKNSPPAPAPKP